jgi:HEAT repeat protein
MTRRSVSLVAAILLVSFPQQQTATLEKRLAQAILVEESERDAARAVRLYLEIGSDSNVPMDVRAQAFLRAGKCEQRLGSEDAAKKSFERAAAMTGPAAEEAKRLLTGENAELERKRERVRKALGDFFDGTGSERKNWSPFESNALVADLVWAGPVAIPELERQLVTYHDDGNRVAQIVRTYIAVGGDEAAAALQRVAQDPDSFLRRSALDGVRGFGSGEPVRSALTTFLRDRDARLRLAALEKLREVVRTIELLPLAADESEAVRALALQTLRKNLVVYEPSGAYPAAVLDVIDTALRDPSPYVRRAACGFFEVGQPAAILADARGRELYLDALGRDELFEPEIGQRRDLQVVNSANSRFDPPLPARKLVEVARQLGPRPIRGDVSERKGALGTMIRRNWNGPPNDVDPWTKEEHALVVELLRLGYVANLGNWVEKYAAVGDAAGVAKVMEEQRFVYGGLSRFFARIRPQLSASDAEPVVRSLEQLLATKLAEREASEKKDSGEVEAAIDCLVALGSAEADRFLLSQVSEQSELGILVAGRFLGRDSIAPAPADVLAGLIALPWTSMHRDPREDSSADRSRIVRLLAERPAPELLPQLASAYERGLQPVPMSHSKVELCGIGFLLLRAGPDRKTEFEPRYDAAPIVAAVDECASIGSWQFWIDASRVLPHLAPASNRDALKDDLARTLAKHVKEWPEGSSNGRSFVEFQRDFVRDYVRLGCAGWEEFAVQNFDDPELGDTIVANVPSLPPELLDRLIAKLPALSVDAAASAATRLATSKESRAHEALLTLRSHAAGGVRYAFVGAVFDGLPDRAVDWTLPLAEDPSAEVRLFVAQKYGRSFDRRVLPVLVEALRDSDKKVRDAAKESLEQLQFYFDQKERWTRLLEGAGLDANGAAESLLKQAAATQPKATRLAALESLGTLGVAETLPFLIQIMGEKDAEIAAAATKAIDRINRREAQKESAPSKSNE